MKTRKVGFNDEGFNGKLNSVIIESGQKWLKVWYSYETPIAFTNPAHCVIRENDWSNTTGKHLNYIDDDKDKRISGERFEKALQLALTEFIK